MNTKKSIIIGAGSHSRAVLSIIKQLEEYEPSCILDIHLSGEDTNETILDIPVKPIDNIKLISNQNTFIFLAIGDNFEREKWFKELSKDFNMPNLISPFALIDKSAQLGTANVVCPNAFIGPEAKIGNNNIFNTGSIIEHEVEILNHCHLAPSSTICGRSNISNNCFVGANSTVIDKINVCEHVIIGAGSTVINSIIEKNSTFVGSPAKIKLRK